MAGSRLPPEQILPAGTAGELGKPPLRTPPFKPASDGSCCIAVIGSENLNGSCGHVPLCELHGLGFPIVAIRERQLSRFQPFPPGC